MIEGAVNARWEAVVDLRIQGSNGRVEEIEAVVDTGYQGFLALPATVVAELALPFSHTSQVILADDTAVGLSVHEAAVLWDGQPIDVDADISGSTPLLGMLLLDGYRLTVDVEVGGDVAIRAMP